MAPTRRAPRLCIVYVTVPDKKIGMLIADAAVSEKLSACAMLGEPVTSIYKWKGVMERTEERVLLLKTTDALFTKLAKRVAAIHPYECPCILKLPVTGAHGPYVTWLLNALH